MQKQIFVEIDAHWFSVEKCETNPNKLYIFGDNLMRVGMAGQAQIRKCYNATGIATKRMPTMEDKAFFNDNDFENLKNELNREIVKIKGRLQNDKNFDTIVFPVDGLGTGLSQLPEKAPKLYKYLCTLLRDEFNIETLQNGKLAKIVNKQEPGRLF